MNDRDTSWDFARGFGMILVVLGHTDFVGRDFVYLFHVPLFFIVSGALFNTTPPLCAKIYKKFKRLYLPNLKYGLIFLLLHNVFVYFHFYTPSSKTNTFYALAKILCWGNEELGGAMWFLRSLFFSYCLYLVLMLVRNKGIRFLLFLLITFAGWLMVDLHYFYTIRTLVVIPCIVCPFIMFGLIYNNYNELKDYLYKYSCSFFVLSGSVLCVAAKCYHIDLAYLSLPNPVVFYLLGCIGFVFVISCCRLLQNSMLYDCITYIGRHSIPVLALHLLAFKLVSFIYLRMTGGSINLLSEFPAPNLPNNIVYPLIYTVVGIAMPLLLNRVGIFLITKFQNFKI